ncbi:hypothetical protein [Williamwhitmania taraxaci]|nr:hypothetical protein [Williamwhitmania taraxaci]
MVAAIKAKLWQWQLKRKKKQADSLQQSTNLQHYVLMHKGTLRVMSARRIRNMRKKGILDKSFGWLRLNEIALYKTK